MKNLLKLEELAQFLVCLGWLTVAQLPWWCYVLLFVGPDISMLGYLANTRVGAFAYNFFHHKGIALLIMTAAAFSDLATVFHVRTQAELGFLVLGVILYGHASLDRIFGYGLKFGDNFHHTHLGWIGKNKGQERAQVQ